MILRHNDGESVKNALTGQENTCLVPLPHFMNPFDYTTSAQSSWNAYSWGHTVICHLLGGNMLLIIPINHLHLRRATHVQDAKEGLFAENASPLPAH